MTKRILITLTCLFSLLKIYGQENAFTSSDISFKNSIKYNKFLISPAFSYAREETPTITLVNRRPWMKFDNSPNQYYLGYLGKLDNNSRFGIGIYNESIGVLSNFGGIVNYAYNIDFSDESDLTFGLNINYYKSSFQLNKIITIESEPLVINTENASFIGIRPGFNLRFSDFDFGIAGNNIALYNLNTSETVKDNQEGSFLGYMMYTYELYNSYGAFADSKFSTLLQVEKKKDATGLSGIAMLDLPYTGWAQAGYNTLQGATAGLGVTISERFSIGYNYQLGLADAMELGSTHELTLAYRFKKYEDTYDYSVQAAKNAKRRAAAGPPPVRVSGAQTQKERLEKLAAEKADKEKLAQLEKERLAQLERDRLAQLAVDKAERDRLAQIEKDKLSGNNVEQERLAQLEKDRLAKLAADKLEQDRLAKLAADKLAADKLAADKAERDRLAQLEKDKLNANKTELDRLAKLEKDRLAKLAADKLAADKAEQNRLAQVEKDRLAKLAADKLAQDKVEQDRLALLEKNRLAKLAADKLAADKAEADRLAQLEKDKLNANKVELDRLAQLEKDRLAKLAADKLAADKIERDRLAQIEKDRLAKLDADKLAADKIERDRLAQIEKDRLAKLAADKLAADKVEQDRLAQLEKDRLAKLAADKLLADKTAQDRLAQLEKDRLAKLAADKLAADKNEQDRLAQLEKDRLAKLAADKAEADRLAKLNAEKSADQLKKEQQLAFDKALAEEKSNQALEAYKRDINQKTKNSDVVLRSLDSLVKARETDLKDYLLEDKLGSDGAPRAPKKFVSTSESNRQVQEMKNKISNAKIEYNKLISDFEAANKIRMNEIKNKGLSQAEMNDFNDYYNKILADLKGKRDAFAAAERKADLKIDEIKEAKEAERLRRIKKADFLSDEERKLKDQQSLDNIKNSTAVTNPANNANNAQGTEDPSNSTDIPIVTNSDTDAGYYLVLGTFTTESARNEFLAKVVGAGGSNVKIFYNLSNVTHYVYIDKYESLTEAKNALKQKGSKSYNGKMYIVSVK